MARRFGAAPNRHPMSGPDSAASDEVFRLRVQLAEAHAALQRASVEAAEREQRRLAQALHDTVCQSLSGIHLMTSVISRKLRASAPEGALEVSELGDALKRAVNELYDLVRWLHPELIESTAELVPALTRLAQATARTVPCELHCPEPISVEDRYSAAQLYQIANDAVHYALRDGQTAEIVISLGTRNDHIELTIRMDGVQMEKRFSDETFPGLEQLRHRASVVGATFTAEPRTSRGILLSFNIPPRVAG